MVLRKIHGPTCGDGEVDHDIKRRAMLVARLPDGRYTIPVAAVEKRSALVKSLREWRTEKLLRLDRLADLAGVSNPVQSTVG